jgi:anti-sigma-K factor RskA
MTCQMMMYLGVYVLGAVDAGERAQVERHLTACPECRAELIRLTPLPGLLASVPAEIVALAQPADEAAGQSLQTGPRARDHRRRTSAARWWQAGTVAACLAAATGSVTILWAATPKAHERPASLVFSGANGGSHVSATAVLTATSWGTSISLRLSGLPLNVDCRLIVRSRTGAAEVAGVWDAWRDGPISVPASAAWRPSDIASLQVVTSARTLVTIKASDRTAHPSAHRKSSAE